MTKTCPFIKGPCIEHQCAMFGQIMGFDGNTGQEVNRWECVFTLMPMLLIENAQQSRQTGAAVESFRNDVVQARTAVIADQQLQRIGRN